MRKPIPEGSYRDLQISASQPARPGIGLTWEEVAGRAVLHIHEYDSFDDTYSATIDGLDPSMNRRWIPAEWVQPMGADRLRKAWRDEQLTESQRQMEFAAAFQRLMWREMMGHSVRKQVGDTVRIKGSARTVERAFPDAWMTERYAACWGQSGTVRHVSREMGDDGELRYTHQIEFVLPESTGFCDMTIWFTGEDLEP